MIILQDTREKIPWNFISYDICLEQRLCVLSEGDYTLHDYPNLVCIERKRLVTEIAINLGKKYKQFIDEMKRLQKYRFRYVICEFPEQELIIYPTNCKLPKRILSRIRMTGKFLHKRISEIIDKYQIEFIFCEHKYEAQDKAIELLIQAKNIYDQERFIESGDT